MRRPRYRPALLEGLPGVATKANHSQEFLLEKRSWSILDARLHCDRYSHLVWLCLCLVSAITPPRKPSRDSFESLLKAMGPAFPISVLFTVTAENNLIFISLKKRRCISSSYAVWVSAPLTFSQISSYDFASELWKEWAWGSRLQKNVEISHGKAVPTGVYLAPVSEKDFCCLWGSEHTAEPWDPQLLLRSNVVTFLHQHLSCPLSPEEAVVRCCFFSQKWEPVLGQEWLAGFRRRRLRLRHHRLPRSYGL